MKRRLSVCHGAWTIVLLALSLPTAGFAQSCATYPNNLQNGQTADAGQVMTNFNCAALLGGANFAGRITFQGLGGSYGSSGAVTIRDAPGDPQAGILQFTDNAVGRQLGYVLGLTGAGGGLGLLGGPVGINTTTPSYTFAVNGSAGGTSSWSSTSDARLKTNVREISNALDIVAHLRGVRFDWLRPEQRTFGRSMSLAVGEPQAGLIAQEVAAVFPEAVTVPKKGSDEAYGLKEANLIPVLIEAIKEQQREITELQSEVVSLKGH